MSSDFRFRTGRERADVFRSGGWGTDGAPLLETFAAIYRTALRGLEGDGGLLATLGTRRLGFGSLEIIALSLAR